MGFFLAIEREPKWYLTRLKILESKGEVIGLKDVLISSIVISNNCVIVTGNVKHFSRIQGVKVENWKMNG